jgi:hypothetical protein
MCKWGKVGPLLGLLLIVVLAGCGSGGGGSSPEAVLKRFITLENQGESEQAMELVAPESRSWLISSRGLASGIIQMAGVKFRGVTVEVLEIQSDETVLRYQARYSVSAYDSTGTARLVKRDGEWKILSLE